MSDNRIERLREHGLQVIKSLKSDELPAVQTWTAMEKYNKEYNHPPVSDEELQSVYDSVADEWSEDRKQTEDLKRFHIFKNGKPTGVFDLEILNHLKEKEKIFILGGVPFLYRGGVYKADPSGAELKTMIRKLIYPELVKSTTIKRVYDLFISDAELQVRYEDLNKYPAEWINFKNGFFDPVNKVMIQHNPACRATNQIPHDFDPDAELTGTAVGDWLLSICDDLDDVEMLSQFSGLCLNRDTRQQKFLILQGEGGSGKSTLIRMIDRMIGSENISNISLSELGQRFSAYGLMGKLLNSCADLEIDALSDVSTLKKVLGEDSLRAEAKGKDAISFKSYAKLIFSTNQLPIVRSEQTNGFYRRLLILTMNRTPEKPDPAFFDKLSANIDDFILISVRALVRMYKSGRIEESPGSIEAVQRLRCDSDTVEAFLSAKTLKLPEEKTSKPGLFREYVLFCQEAERQALTKSNFFKAMRVKGFSVLKTGGLEYFRGIKMRENFSISSPENSLKGFEEIKGDQIPFS